MVRDSCPVPSRHLVLLCSGGGRPDLPGSAFSIFYKIVLCCSDAVGPQHRSWEKLEAAAAALKGCQHWVWAGGGIGDLWEVAQLNRETMCGLSSPPLHAGYLSSSLTLVNRGHPLGWGGHASTGIVAVGSGRHRASWAARKQQGLLAVMNESSGPRGLAASHQLGIKVAWRAPSV